MALWRVRATVDDRPGFLAVLTASLALRSINILTVQVHTTEEGAVDDFLLDAPDNLTEQDLLAAIGRGRGRDAWVVRSDARGLVDPPTQIASLAARLVTDPSELGPILGSLFGCLARHQNSPTVAGHGPTTMSVADPGGGTIVLTRLAPTFTPAEFARAQALAEVARAALGRAPVMLRPAEKADLTAIAAMHERCGSRTLFLRYFSGTRGPSHTQLQRLLSPSRGAALVAEAVHSGQIVALGNLVGEGELSEVAVLVEDAWQRKGIGTAVLRRMVSAAAGLGLCAVVVHTHSGNEAMRRTVRRIRPDALFELDSGMATATIPVGRVAQGVRR
ncbi:MAG TPA: GNAT family N-acetyltransferase [Candidatus Limnocylindrales bacterium]|nr:GNAT family N-acetyltransferase [Candidatus Limnocylindrales bacterium]